MPINIIPFSVLFVVYAPDWRLFESVHDHFHCLGFLKKFCSRIDRKLIDFIPGILQRFDDLQRNHPGKCLFQFIRLKPSLIRFKSIHKFADRFVGITDLYRQYEELKARLLEMGMFDAIYKKPIPAQWPG